MTNPSAETASTAPSQPGTYDLYDKLPPLPVPSLAETRERYLASVRPLVDDATYTDVVAAFDELMAPGSTGEMLQSHLEQRGRDRDNWLAGWWEDAAYLAYPDPIPINSSIGISTDARVTTGDQVARATDATMGALAFYKEIIDGTFPPEVQRNGAPFDMTLLKRFYGTTRLPGTDKDRIVTHGPDDARHIVVFRGQRIYPLQVIDEDGRWLSEGEVRAHLTAIVAASDAADAAGTPVPWNVAALTSRERNTWAEARLELASDPTNRQTLDLMERALFHLCLDINAYPDFTSLARAALHGGRGNRWFDKSFSLIVDTDGRLCLHGEHSPVDAGTWCPLMDRIGTPRHDVVDIPEGLQGVAPRALSWNVGEGLAARIASAEAAHQAAIDNLDLQVVHFDAFGKNHIKTLKTGPDPIIQMAYQLAYRRVMGRTPKTYESASTRSCRLGRTETIRVASPQSKAFVDAMLEEGRSDGERRELLRAAFAEHSIRARDASAGYGSDRHLLGLALMARELGVAAPRLFSLPIHTMPWELSTAQVPMAVAMINHFGPVCPQGYGIGYVVKNDTITMNITSFRAHPETDTQKFADAIVAAFHELSTLLVAEA